MTYFYKCKNCAVYAKTCERRQKVKSAIKGHGVTSIKFRCPDRVPLFDEGQRVQFKWSHWGESARDYYGECEEDVLTFTGTVVCENEQRGRFVVRVDDVAVQSGLDESASYFPKDVFRNGGFAVKVRPDAMQAIDEPAKTVCPDCLGYDAGERCQKSEYVRPSCQALCAKRGPA